MAYVFHCKETLDPQTFAKDLMTLHPVNVFFINVDFGDYEDMIFHLLSGKSGLK